jgi:RNA polymerase sigma-70 factor (ECF subfamily)
MEMSVVQVDHDDELSELSDNMLMRRFQQTRDQRCFELLWDRHRSDIYRRCLAFLRDRQGAEDAVQAAFHNALAKADSFQEGNGEFGSWIQQIARHWCINQVSSAHARLRVSADDMLESLPAAPGDTELANLVRNVLSELGPEQRITLKLLYVEGLSYEEIAKLQGWTVAQVKTYAQNGRRMFQRRWDRMPKR